MLINLETKMQEVYRGRVVERYREVQDTLPGFSFGLPPFPHNDFTWMGEQLKFWGVDRLWGLGDVLAVFEAYESAAHQSKLVGDIMEDMERNLVLTPLEVRMLSLKHDKYRQSLSKNWAMAQILRLLQYVRFMYDMPYRRSNSMYLIRWGSKTYGFYYGEWVSSRKGLKEFLNDPSRINPVDMFELNQTTLNVPIYKHKSHYDKIFRTLETYTDTTYSEFWVWNVAAACGFDFEINRSSRRIAKGK